MNALRRWLWANLDVILTTAIALIVVLVLMAGCASAPPPNKDRFTVNYSYCKGGIGGDWRVATERDSATGEEVVVLFLFSVGGPYDKDHILCAVSGDHAILDLGKGQRS